MNLVEVSADVRSRLIAHASIETSSTLRGATADDIIALLDALRGSGAALCIASHDAHLVELGDRSIPLD